MITPRLTRIAGIELEQVRTDLATFRRELIQILTIPDLSSVATSSAAGFAAGWSDVTNQEVRWYKDGLSRVFLWGLVQKVGPAFPELIFTFQAGYRPAQLKTFWIGASVVNVEPDGDVIVVAFPGYAGQANLTGISFLAEQ